MRGTLLPLIRMAEVFEIDPTYYDPVQDEIKPDRRRNIADRRSKATPLFKEEDAPPPVPRSSEQELKRKANERRQSASSALNMPRILVVVVL